MPIMNRNVGTCLRHVSNALTHIAVSKHAEGMSLRYGVAILGVCGGGLEKRGAPPLCVGVRLGMGG